MNLSKKEILFELKGWTPPFLSQGKETYISFSAFDPVTRRMKRKKIMLGRIKGKAALKAYAKEVIRKLTEKLMNGWNPWIENCSVLEYTPFTEVCDRYRTYLEKMLADDDMREETFASYTSYMRIFSSWAENHGAVYIYQVDRRMVCAFLDYVFVERNNTLQTRNNYLAWLKSFSTWCIQRSYITVNPTEGLTAVQRRAKKKNRSVISEEDLKRLHEFLMERNRHYLLACMLLHYMFIRPHEMTFIRIGDISVKKSTLSLHGESTKNRNDAVLTIPAKVLRLMVDLKVFDHPDDFYLFSENFTPGRVRVSEKVFRDFWLKKVRRELKFPAQYKFYSLKDTGITNMLRSNMDVLTVRDQARHSSIMITDHYTPKDIKEVNKALLHYEGSL